MWWYQHTAISQLSRSSHIMWCDVISTLLSLSCQEAHTLCDVINRVLSQCTDVLTLAYWPGTPPLHSPAHKLVRGHLSSPTHASTDCSVTETRRTTQRVVTPLWISSPYPDFERDYNNIMGIQRLKGHLGLYRTTGAALFLSFLFSLKAQDDLPPYSSQEECVQS